MVISILHLYFICTLSVPKVYICTVKKYLCKYKSVLFLKILLKIK